MSVRLPKPLVLLTTLYNVHVVINIVQLVQCSSTTLHIQSLERQRSNWVNYWRNYESLHNSAEQLETRLAEHPSSHKTLCLRPRALWNMVY